MLILILFICGMVSVMSAGVILLLQQYKVNRGVIILDENYNGPREVSQTLNIIIRFILRRSVYFRKFLAQYVLHIMVRVMSYIDDWSTYMYSKSRNWFVKNAVRNRGTVPHFWEHLKVYKQEMDKEKDDKVS